MFDLDFRRNFHPTQRLHDFWVIVLSLTLASEKKFTAQIDLGGLQKGDAKKMHSKSHEWNNAR